jgi:predicted SAM-dependent methyltransferase
MVGKIKVHFGCASHKLADWINVDLNRFCKPDLVADLTKPFPFKSNSVDYIHSEDFLDQIELADAYILAGEFTNPKKRWSYENSHSEFKRICQKISERR